MKKQFLLTLGVFCSFIATSQQAPTPNPPSDPTTNLPNPQKGAYAWYRGGNSNAFNSAGTSNIFGTLWNSPIYTVTNGITRMTILGNVNAPYNRNGFVGFNNSDPRFHLDINTQNPGGTIYGELLFRARITDDPNAYISFVNIATTGPVFVPTLLARQSNNPNSALTTIGSINNNQDIALNPAPVTRFFSAINYDPSVPTLALGRVNVIENRRIFGWYNGIDQLMTMEANGFLGVGTTDPRNRVEINSDFYGPNGLPTGAGGGPVVTDQTDNTIPGLGGLNATGFSGLRFTDLTANSNPMENNPGLGMLALDSNGDVVYVQASTGSGFIECADNSGAANLTADSKISLNDYNIYFETNNVFGQNHVGFGYDNCPVLPAKVSVLQTHPAAVPDNSTGILAVNEDVSSVVGRTYYGVQGEARGVQAPQLRIDNVGGEFIAANATDNFGIMARVAFPAVVPTPLFANNYGAYLDVVGAGFNNRGVQIRVGDALVSNAGVIATASTTFGNTSLLNVAGDFLASGATNDNIAIRAVGVGGQQTFGVLAGASAAQAGGVSYGIYSSCGPSSGSNPPSGPNYAGYFDGDVVRTGTDNFTSDANLKTNVMPISDAVSIVEQLNPVSFEFDQSIYPHMHLAQGLNYGFIAQDVESILPELVSENIHPAQFDSLGNVTIPAVSYKSLNYQAFISILAKGLQEQQTELNEKDSIINELNTRLTNLENCLSALLPVLCQISNSSIVQNSEETAREIQQAIDVHLSDKSAIILNQNVPNPFAERSVISFVIPETVEKAQIIFYDAQGKLINAVDINERGEGQLNVFASDLSTGIYTYSLVADGKVVATKRMMKN
jgi:hypothetical protein